MTDKYSEERSYKEQRIREITFIYYSRAEVRKALLEFSKNRESIPRYFESFGKRPDAFQYESDILEQVKKGATSFHCSEELWNDPLELSTNMSRPEFNELRIGWDLLLDIDSKYLEYSKMYAELIVYVLRLHKIENFGIKFSGSKGFHIIIPWKAFPQEIYNQKTKDMFPEWPRIICSYLADIIKPKLSEKIFQDQNLKNLAEKTGRKEDELIIDECVSCHRKASKKVQIQWVCRNCKNIEMVKIETSKRIPKCFECGKQFVEKDRKEILYCEYCSIDALKNPELFNKAQQKTELLIDADLILVAPRHLFRMPYSLHEKTALSSIVLDKNEVKNFQINDAKPLKAKMLNFYPEPIENEARSLLLQALDWNEQKEREEKTVQEKKGNTTTIIKPKSTSKEEYKKITIPNPSDDIFPPQIKLLLKGVAQDGRKRALFILLSFFSTLGVAESEIEKRIYEWNARNYMPLKKGYIQSQLSWYKRNPNRLPPNFNNPIYKELGVDKPDALSMQTKNPINYAIKKYFMMK